MSCPLPRDIRRLRTLVLGAWSAVLLLGMDAGQAAAPVWWGARGVYRLDPHTGLTAQADDYAYLNQGQLKTLATAAYDELEANLPGGAGPAVTQMVKSWFQLDASGAFSLDSHGARIPVTSGVDGFAVANVGQVKNVAKPFYDQLIAAGMYPMAPWALSPNPPSDFAPANLGQAKNLFAFVFWSRATVTALGSATLSAHALSGTQVLLAWNGTVATAGETFLLERQAGGGAFQQVATLTPGGGWIDTSVGALTTYSYRIRAVGPEGESAFSGLATVTTSGQAAMSLSGVRLWLDAETATGPQVAAWQDLSGNGFNALQTNSVRQPQVTANVANGLPAVHFSGSSLPLTAGIFQGLSGAEMLTVHRVALSQSIGWENGYHTLGATPGGSYYPFYGLLLDDFCSTARQNLGIPLPPVDHFHLYDTASQNGEWTGRLNGAVQYTTASNTFAAPSAPLLGLAYDYFAGDIAELLIFDHVLTPAEREAWSEYLNGKYAFVPAPPVVAGLSADPLPGFRVGLHWTASPTATGYRIERQAGAGSFSTIGSVSAQTVFADSGLAPGVTYTYRVFASALGQEAAASATASATVGQESVTIALSGLQLWLRADSGATVDTQGNVAALRDLSGNARNAVQATPTSQPVLGVSPENGLPTLRFNGVTSSLSIPSALSRFDQGVTVFVVAKPTDTGSYARLLDFGASAGTSSLFLARSSTAPSLFWYCASPQGDVRLTAPGVFTVNENAMYTAVQDGGSVRLLRNGVLLASAAATPATAAPLTSNFLGKSNGSGDALFQGEIAEVLVYTRALSDPELQAVHSYLEARYAVIEPSRPAQLTARAVSASQINLSWSPGTELTSYQIQRQGPSDSGFSPIATVDATVRAYFDQNLSASTSYSYRVVSLGPTGASLPSLPAGATTTAASGVLPTGSLVLWLRADSGVATSSGRVTQWSDLSGQGNDATSTTNPPQLVAGAINQQPAIRFDGGASSLRFPGTEPFADGITAFVVGISHGAGPRQQLFSLNGISTGGPIFGRREGSTDLEFRLSNFSGGDLVAPGAFLVELPQLWEYSQSGTDAQIFTNGVLTARGEVIPLSATARDNGYYLGGFAYNANSPQTFQQDLAEVLLYRGRLSEADRQAVELYLGQRYALAPASLPAPANLQATVVGSGEAAVSWYFPSALSGTEIALERRQGAGAYVEIGRYPDSKSALDRGLTPGSGYTYRARAIGLSATSPYSGEFSLSLPAQGSPSLPSAGLRLRLSAQDLATSPLATWGDLSGLGNDATQTAAGAQPLLFFDDANGLPAVHFDGAATFLSFPAALTAGATAGEIFLFQRSSVNQDDAPTLYAAGGAGNGGHLLGASGGSNLYPGADGFIHDDFGSNLQHVSGEPALPLDRFHLYHALSTATGWSSDLNGEPLFATPVNSVVFPAQARLGGVPSGFFAGEVAEVLLYDRALTPAERLFVQSYLLAKYGLLAAPATPENLQAAADPPNGVRLVWDYPLEDSVASFVVERKGATGDYAVIGTADDAPVWFDQTVQPSSTYTYRIHAVSAGGTSPLSSEANVITPADRVGQWVDRELRVIAGRAGHSFLLQLNGVTVQAFLPSGLVEQADGNGGYGTYARVAATVDVAHLGGCTLVDGFSGDRLPLLGVDPQAAIVDLTAAAWLDSQGQPCPTQYFILPAARQADRLALVTGTGGWSAATVAPFAGAILQSDFGATQPGDRVEASAPFDPAASYHLVDLTTSPMQVSPFALTDLVPVSWLVAPGLVVPATNVAFVVSAGDAGRVFTVTVNGVATQYTAGSITVNGQTVVGFFAGVPMDGSYTVSAAGSSLVVAAGTGIGTTATVDLSQSFPAPPPPLDPTAVIDTDGSIIGLQVFTPPL